MNFQDKTLTCRDCGQEFVWTASEQEFYASKGFDNPPSRCPACRAKHKAARQGGGSFRGGHQGPRQMFTVNCADCGVETQVPFEPKEGRPVYCREHFAQHNERRDDDRQAA